MFLSLPSCYHITMFDSPVMFFPTERCQFRPSRNDASALHCVHGCITSSFRLEDGIGIRAGLDALEDSNHLSQGIFEWWENDGFLDGGFPGV